MPEQFDAGIVPGWPGRYRRNAGDLGQDDPGGSRRASEMEDPAAMSWREALGVSGLGKILV